MTNDVPLLDQELGEPGPRGAELGARAPSSTIALPALVGECRRPELGLRSMQRYSQIILRLENFFILFCTLFLFSKRLYIL
jgi:hypothetical protein